jgi:hypothetical protein
MVISRLLTQVCESFALTGDLKTLTPRAATKCRPVHSVKSDWTATTLVTVMHTSHIERLPCPHSSIAFESVERLINLASLGCRGGDFLGATVHNGSTAHHTGTA